MFRRRALAAAAALIAAVTVVTPTTTNAAPTPDVGAQAITNRVVGYFVQWGVYARNYHVKNIRTSGSASKLTHLNYAFGNVSGGRCTIGDAYADYDKFYDAASSVDGTSDTWDPGALRGNFNQLRKLKKLHPNIKILWSFGGWTWSGGFGEAARNATAFADSCYRLVARSTRPTTAARRSTSTGTSR
jgi:chitinase